MQYHFIHPGALGKPLLVPLEDAVAISSRMQHELHWHKVDGLTVTKKRAMETDTT
jgi:hypothetical protein